MSSPADRKHHAGSAALAASRTSDPDLADTAAERYPRVGILGHHADDLSAEIDGLHVPGTPRDRPMAPAVNEVNGSVVRLDFQCVWRCYRVLVGAIVNAW